MGIDRDAVAAWVDASCAAQGVPVPVTDSGVLARVGVLLKGAGVAGVREAGPATPALSAGPDRNDADGVELAGRTISRVHGGVIEHRANDRGLSTQRQGRPTGAQLVSVADKSGEGVVAGELTELAFGVENAGLDGFPRDLPLGG